MQKPHLRNKFLIKKKGIIKKHESIKRIRIGQKSTLYILSIFCHQAE